MQFPRLLIEEIAARVLEDKYTNVQTEEVNQSSSSKTHKRNIIVGGAIVRRRDINGRHVARAASEELKILRRLK